MGLQTPAAARDSAAHGPNGTTSARITEREPIFTNSRRHPETTGLESQGGCREEHLVSNLLFETSWRAFNGPLQRFVPVWSKDSLFPGDSGVCTV
jgi:hypothetical protein